MKKIYLIIAFTIIGLASLYAMFSYKMAHLQEKQNVQSKKNTIVPTTTSTVANNKSVLDQEQQQLILGDWILEDDPRSTCVYKNDGICYKYYDGELTTKYQYSFSNTTPQCGYDVSTGPNLNYLKWVDVEDTNNTFCFDLASLTDSVLNMRLLGTGDFAIYIRPGYSGTGTIDVPVYYNTTQSRTFQGRKTCPPRFRAVGGNYTHTVPAATYSSEISQADADQKALNDIQQNGQRIADSKVICQP